MVYTTLSGKILIQFINLYTEDYHNMNKLSYGRNVRYMTRKHLKNTLSKVYKGIFIASAAAMCLSMTAKPVFADAAVAIEKNNDGNYINTEYDSSLKASYNGNDYNNEIFPAIRVDNVWMVPVKEFLVDILGCTYNYDDEKNILEITNNYGNITVSANIGSSELNTGSSTVSMALAVMKAKDTEDAAKETIYVPAEKVIENLGYGYDSSTTELNVIDNINFYKYSNETQYESQYSNALNSITYTKDSSGNDVINVTALKEFVEDNITVSSGDDSIEYVYNGTKNLLGDIDKSFDNNSIVSAIKMWEENNNTHLKITFDNRYVTNKTVSGNTFSVAFKKGSFSIKALIPDNVKADKITATDRYWNKQFYIIVPGDYVSFYKEHKPVNNSSAIKKINVNKTSTGNTRIVVTTTKLQGYKITRKDGYFTVKVGSPKNIYKNIILLDAGHGGKDSGARYGSLYEKKLNLEILYTRARKYFEANNSNVKAYWTRHDDTFINLYTRPTLSKTYNADMFLSLHMNSAGNRLANGTEVYYSSNNNKVTSTGLYSKKMASMMLSSVIGGVNSKNRGVRQAGFVVNKYNTVPSVLVELGFITGNKDYPNLKKAAYREKAAKALYDGVENIFKKYPTGR